MTIYLANAFSLSMLQSDSVISVRKINIDQAKQALSNGFLSAVGHEGTAQLLSKLLGVNVAVNRVAIKLLPADVLIVFQLQTRLTEGAVLTEEQLKALQYTFFRVTMNEGD